MGIGDRSTCLVCGEQLKRKKRKFCSMICMGKGRRGSASASWKAVKKERDVIDQKNLPASVISRFWSKVTKSDKCWLWSGNRDRRGYGSLRFGHTQIRASRLSWLIHYGVIPGDLFACHKCDNPPCVNPAHLFLGTNRDNMQDMKSKGRDLRRSGLGCSWAKLTIEQADQIRRKYVPWKYSSSMLANEYGVSKKTILKIVKGMTYGHI